MPVSSDQAYYNETLKKFLARPFWRLIAVVGMFTLTSCTALRPKASVQPVQQTTHQQENLPTASIEGIEQRCALISAGSYPDAEVGKLELSRYVFEQLYYHNLVDNLIIQNRDNSPQIFVDGKQLSSSCSVLITQDILLRKQSVFNCGTDIPILNLSRRAGIEEPQEHLPANSESLIQAPPGDSWSRCGVSRIASIRADNWISGHDLSISGAVVGGIAGPVGGAARGAIGGGLFAGILEVSTRQSAAIAAEGDEFKPWPPPAPSALLMLSSKLISDRSRFPNLGTLAKYIEKQFRAGGYEEFSYFTAPGGFALVTQLEQFAKDGNPISNDHRWVSDLTPDTPVPISPSLLSLFDRPIGRYRFFVVFVTTDLRGSDMRATVSVELAQQWIKEGQRTLDNALAKAPINPDAIAYLNIYEFAREQGAPPMLKGGCSVDPKKQLSLAHINLELEE